MNLATPERLVALSCEADARSFEPVVAALEDTTPRVEVVRPGMCVFGTCGPSRYFGGEDALVARVVGAVSAALGADAKLGIGIADGFVAANLATNASLAATPFVPCVVPEGCSARFLSSFGVEVLGDADMAGVLGRLGLHTVGSFAELGAPDVLARFGAAGAAAHTVARGGEVASVAQSTSTKVIEVRRELDPPAGRVDEATFVGRGLAAEFQAQLAPAGLSASLVQVTAETTAGFVSQRHWRHEGGLEPAALTQRLRWQLDGWLTQLKVRQREAPGAISAISFRAIQVSGAVGRQVELWGGHSSCSDEVLKGVARVQALLGHGAVRAPELGGGRSFGDRYKLVSVEEVDLERGAASFIGDDRPWPGQLPDPPPALVHPNPVAVQLYDHNDEPVGVSGRGVLSARPAVLSIGDGPPVGLIGWAGPWIFDERWWDPLGHRRRARLQVLTRSQQAYLLAIEAGSWWLEATYD